MAAHHGRMADAAVRLALRVVLLALIAGAGYLVKVSLPGEVPGALAPFPDEETWTTPSAQPGVVLSPRGPKIVVPKSLQLVPQSVQLRVTTANIQGGLSWNAAAGDLSRVMSADTDIVGINETSPERAVQLHGFAASRGWDAYTAPTQPSIFRAQNAVLWNAARFSKIQAGSEFGSPSITPQYKIDTRWITWVMLRHRASGQIVSFVQTHMDPGSLKGRHVLNRAVIDANAQYQKRLLQLCRQLARRGVVVVGGDWNVDANANRHVADPALPFTMLEGRGRGPLLSTYSVLGLPQLPTHMGGPVWIDYLAVWSTASPRLPRLTITGQRVGQGQRSDHRPLTAELRMDYLVTRR